MIRTTIHPAPLKRRGFTLVELLVVVVVIGILAGMVFGAVTAAQQSARANQTKGTVAKIHRILMRKMADYRTRRVPDPAVNMAGLNRAQKAEVRLNCLRDLIRMEMPDRWTDVTNGLNWKALQDTGKLFPPSLKDLSPAREYRFEPHLLLKSSPAASYYFYRKLYDAAEGLQGDPDIYGLINKHAAAELLYLIVMQDCENAEQFRSNEIGDSDGDGLMEFHDAWGRPIRFLRWPAGFIPSNGADTDLQSGDATKDNDPFDTLGIYNSIAYRLVPLIYSAGPDGIYDINIGTEGGATYAYRLDTGNYYTAGSVKLDAYAQDGNAPPKQIGAPLDGDDVFTGASANGRLDHQDNIHNHQSGM